MEVVHREWRSRAAKTSQNLSPTHWDKSLLKSSLFLAAASGRFPIKGALEEAGKERCKLGIEQKWAAHDCVGADLINLLGENQKKKEGE